MSLQKVEGYAEPDELTDTVIDKYKIAAQFTNKALAKVLAGCIEGADTQELCSLGDQLLHEATSAVYKSGIEKGIAEPTTMNVNNCLSGYSPMDSPYVLQVGDIVKVSLGAHIDGYTAKCCHTVVVTSGMDVTPVTGRSADSIVAAHFASEAVVKLLASSETTLINADRIRKLVDETAATFNVKVTEGSKVRRIKRYLVGQAQVEEDALGTDRPKQVEWVRHVPGLPQLEDEEFIVEQGDVWLIDIAMSTGSGKVREHLTLRPTIFARNVAVTYNLKLKSAQQVLSEINKTKSVFPFCLRSLSDQRTARLGIAECRNRNIVTTYPVLVEHPREFIARQACTLLIHKSGGSAITRLTGGGLKVPWATSEYEVIEGSELDKTMKMNVSVREIAS